MALPVAAFPEMLAKSVIMRAITATRTGCAQGGMGQTTPFSGRGSRNAAEDDPKPSILQLNTEGLTENKIFIIEQLAYKNKAFIIVLQETHCTTADKLVTPNFLLAGSRGDPLHNCRQASDSQLLTSWVNPVQELRHCHVCPRAVGMVTGR